MRAQTMLSMSHIKTVMGKIEVRDPLNIEVATTPAVVPSANAAIHRSLPS